MLGSSFQHKVELFCHEYMIILTALFNVEFSTTAGAATAAKVAVGGVDGCPLLTTMSALPETMALPSATETSPSKPFW